LLTPKITGAFTRPVHLFVGILFHLLQPLIIYRSDIGKLCQLPEYSSVILFVGVPYAKKFKVTLAEQGRGAYKSNGGIDRFNFFFVFVGIRDDKLVAHRDLAIDTTSQTVFIYTGVIP
jgi:hypothetical protein